MDWAARARRAAGVARCGALALGRARSGAGQALAQGMA